MNLRKITLLIVFSLFICGLPVLGKSVLQVSGKSLTPDGGQVSLAWRVEMDKTQCTFYLSGREKARLILKDGKVVEVRRLIRYAGKDRWIVFKTPAQVALELKSGFYPFEAVMNFRKSGTRHTVMRTGQFEIQRSPAR